MKIKKQTRKTKHRQVKNPTEAFEVGDGADEV